MFIFIKFIIWLILIVGVVIFIHEFGHFIAAKVLGIKVEEFAFGFGKKIYGKKKGNTLYRINLIPLGGYVKLLGEEEAADHPESFSKKSFVIKFIVIVAGAVMNLFLAAGIFYIILGMKDNEIFLPVITDYHFIGSEVEVQNKPIVERIIEDTPADKADFPTDVVIWSINDVEIKEVTDVTFHLEEHKGEEVTIGLLSAGGQRSEIKVIPEETDREGVLLGVEFYNAIIPFYKLDYSTNKYFSGVLHSINIAGYNFDVLKSLLVISFQEKTVEPVAEGVVGFVGLADTTFSLVRVGDVFELLNWVALINISIACVNLMPIPVLDGGYILFMIIEKIRGKELSEELKAKISKITFAVLIFVVILITIKDIIQFKVISRIVEFIRDLF